MTDPRLDSILALLTGLKVYDSTTGLWRVYDKNGIELADPGGVLLSGLHGWLLETNAKYSPPSVSAQSGISRLAAYELQEYFLKQKIAVEEAASPAAIPVHLRKKSIVRSSEQVYNYVADAPVFGQSSELALYASLCSSYLYLATENENAEWDRKQFEQRSVEEFAARRRRRRRRRDEELLMLMAA